MLISSSSFDLKDATQESAPFSLPIIKKVIFSRTSGSKLKLSKFRAAPPSTISQLRAANCKTSLPGLDFVESEFRSPNFGRNQKIVRAIGTAFVHMLLELFNRFKFHKILIINELIVLVGHPVDS